MDSATHRTELTLSLGPGAWRAEWIDTKTGAVAKTEDVAGGKIASPEYTEDIAVRLRAR